MEHYIKGFGQWLERLGYADSTIYGYGRRVNTFFLWMEQQGLALAILNKSHLDDYSNHLKHRPKKNKQAGGLCIASIREHLQVMITFASYLQQYHQLTIPVADLSSVPLHQHIKQSYAVLTQHEIKRLYQATDNSLYGIRDRAILALYYGCGLRSSEGLHVKAEDIDWRRRCLHVIAGKGNKDRIVPISCKALEDLREYNERRKDFTNAGTGFFLLSAQAKNKAAMSGQNLLARIKKLAEAAEIKKEVTVHSLRHSIATHLLQQGMSLDHIRQFLGHSSMETTGKYVHIKMLIEQEEYGEL
jgi:integrase/recombinase XerD